MTDETIEQTQDTAPAEPPAVETKAEPKPEEKAPASVLADAPPAVEPAKDPEVKADWREDWREALAAGITGKAEGEEYEKELKRLKRFTSLPNVLRSYRALESRISAGELKEPFPADGSPEDQAKWRAANGIPESPDKYDLKLSEGLTIGEEDKPFIDAVLKAAHDKNIRPEAVNAVVDAYYQEQDRILAERESQDRVFLEETQESLRTEFGPEYRRNVEAAKAYLAGLPEGLGALIAGARLADGRMLGGHPAAARWLIQIAQELNPIASLIPGGAGDIKGIDDELAEISKYRRENRDAYYRDEKMQARERQLLAAKEKLDNRAA